MQAFGLHGIVPAFEARRNMKKAVRCIGSSLHKVHPHDPMKQVSIRPVWTIQDAEGTSLPARLIELLVLVAETGSLLHAARALGMSYRRAWDLVRLGEQVFHTPLLVMERGKGSTLTDLGARIVWADKRIHARLRPALETLSSELAEELRGALSEAPSALRIQASHGFAIERLIERLAQDGLKLNFSYASSSAAAAAGNAAGGEA